MGAVSDSVATVWNRSIEDAKPEHLAAGCNVLLHAMLARAGAAA